MLTGWPPPELLVTVSITSGTAAARSDSNRSSAATSMLPLNGWRAAGCRPSATGRSTALAPVNSILARVVSKWVLFGTIRPGPPIAVNRIFSAARPWCVGNTCANGNRPVTAARNRWNDGAPA
jgi:hypothetical protein